MNYVRWLGRRRRQRFTRPTYMRAINVVTENYIHSVTRRMQEDGMIAIKRRNLCEKLGDYLFAARNCTANDKPNQ